MLDRLTAAGRRRRSARRLPDGPLRRYLDTPAPAAGTALADLPLLAVDVETSGLDPARDRLLSVGFLPVDGERIMLSGADSLLLRPDDRTQTAATDPDGVGQSATLHGITDDALATGVTERVGLDRLFEALTGRVLLAHYTRMEVDFLGGLCTRVYGIRPPFVTVDTLDLHLRVLGGGKHMGFTAAPTRGEVRLWAARKRYGLPRYRVHDALIDALACAELYLAQTAELADRGVASLRDLR